MPRITKVMLEEQIELLNRKLIEERRMSDFYKAQLDIFTSMNQLPISTMTIALERVTDALAHVVGDLKRRYNGEVRG